MALPQQETNTTCISLLVHWRYFFKTLITIAIVTGTKKLKTYHANPCLRSPRKTGGGPNEMSSEWKSPIEVDSNVFTACSHIEKRRTTQMQTHLGPRGVVGVGLEIWENFDFSDFFSCIFQAIAKSCASDACFLHLFFSLAEIKRRTENTYCPPPPPGGGWTLAGPSWT